MKIFKKSLVIFLVFFIVSFILIGGFFKIKGRDIIVAKLTESLDKQVDIGKINLGFPLRVKIDDFEIKEFVNIEYLSASASVLGLLSGRLILNNVTVKNPYLLIERFKDGSFNFLSKKDREVSKSGKKMPSKESKKENSLLILGIDVTGGEIVFKDRTAQFDNFTINAKDLNFHISKTSFLPTDLKIKFSASGMMYAFDPKRTGVFDTGGWIDFTEKDMDGIIDIKGGDCMIILPYLKFISSERLRKGRFNMHSTLKAEDNNLTVTTELELEDLAKAVLAEKKEEKDVMDIFEGNVFDFLKDEQDKVAVKFIYRSKLDNPLGGALDVKSVAENIIQDKLFNHLGKENGLEKIKKISENFEDIGKIFKEKFKK